MLFLKSASDHNSPRLDCKNLPLQLKAGISFSIPWIWVGYVTCSDQWGISNCSLEQLLLMGVCFSDLITLPPPCEKAQVSLLEGEGILEVETGTANLSQPTSNQSSSNQRCLSKSRRDQGNTSPPKISPNSTSQSCKWIKDCFKPLGFGWVVSHL